jgi:hypothetical protein
MLHVNRASLSHIQLIEALSKPQIRLKSKAQDAGGVMCNIWKSAAYTGVCEHFEEVCNAAIGP